MGLKINEETLDAVDEIYHSLYTEQEGKFVLTGIDGMKTDADISRMNVALTKERAATNELKQKFSILAGKDPIEILASLDRIPELEALAAGNKVDDEKIETIVETRLRAKLNPLERQLEAEKAKIVSLEGINKMFIEKEKTVSIHSAVRKAATAANVRPEAIDDAITLAERFFELSDDGSVIAKDIVGVTQGIDPAMWLSDLQAKKPHWWGESVGGGAGGTNSNSGFSGVSNPWSADNWNLTEQGKLYSKNPAKAEQMANAAGSSVGASRPTKK